MLAGSPSLKPKDLSTSTDRRATASLLGLVLLATLSKAEDVTLFQPALPAPTETPVLENLGTFLGVEPVSVDDAGCPLASCNPRGG
ncbi:hypothetical protein CC2G_003438 [Coprinopsis cinerea AmutBmut pab1-1]|nr:hypothetical protein CC2G_003438 [Coprinopsis cinerea AmutBmut pab1-1]